MRALSQGVQPAGARDGDLPGVRGGPDSAARLDGGALRQVPAARAGAHAAGQPIPPPIPPPRQDQSSSATEETASFPDDTSVVGSPADFEEARLRTVQAEFADRYEVLAAIGHGGMGAVYKAKQKQPERVVVLKVMLSGRFASEKYRIRFEREAQAIARLKHPGIVSVYEYGEVHGQPVLQHGVRRGLQRAGVRHPPSPGQARHLPADGKDSARSGLRPPARHHPPRPEAGQHPGRRPGQSAAARLRPGAAGGRPVGRGRRRDRRRRGDGHAVLHEPGADAGAGGGDRPAQRRLLDGRALLRAADRLAAVPHRPQPPAGEPARHPRLRAQAALVRERQAGRGPGRDGDEVRGERAGDALPERGGAERGHQPLPGRQTGGGAAVHRLLPPAQAGVAAADAVPAGLGGRS